MTISMIFMTPANAKKYCAALLTPLFDGRSLPST